MGTGPGVATLSSTHTPTRATPPPAYSAGARPRCPAPAPMTAKVALSTETTPPRPTGLSSPCESRGQLLPGRPQGPPSSGQTFQLALEEAQSSNPCRSSYQPHTHAHPPRGRRNSLDTLCAGDPQGRFHVTAKPSRSTSHHTPPSRSTSHHTPPSRSTSHLSFHLQGQPHITPPPSWSAPHSICLGHS